MDQRWNYTLRCSGHARQWRKGNSGQGNESKLTFTIQSKDSGENSCINKRPNR